MGFTGLWSFQLDYTDKDDASDWAYEALCWMTMKGIVNGKANKVLDPKGNAKRSEVAQIIKNFDEKAN